MKHLIQQIIARVDECVRIAETKLGIKMPVIDVRFDLRGRAAGMAGYTTTMGKQKFYLRFNYQHMQLGGQTWQHLIEDTVPHEVAHSVCQAFPSLGRNHNQGWARVCRLLGGNGQRCYSEQDAPEAIAAQRPYVYITTTGHEVRVTKAIHGKIQTGKTYLTRGGKGQLTKGCRYNYMTAPTVVVPQPVHTAQPKPAAEAATAGVSRAAQIRAYIRQGHSVEQCIQYAMTALGMAPSLARKYVTENWNKK